MVYEKNRMEKIIRSKHGYEESNTACPWCEHEHDVRVLDKTFKRSGNKCTMHSTCDKCDKRVRLQLHKLGHYSFYKYIDYKKRRRVKDGWQQQRFRETIDYSTEFLKS
jgi:transcription elongation factor Elf1